MRRTLVGVLTIGLLVALSLPALAQQASGAAPKYNLATETTLKGTIDEVKEITTAKGDPSIHLMLKAGSELLEVYLCPNAFLREMQMGFTKGDQVEVIGSKVKVGEADVILAKEVTKGNDTLILRDRKGAPAWAPVKHG